MLVRDTLFLAATRPALKWGVPAEGLWINVGGTALIFAWVGRGNPLYWALFPLLHFPMVAQTNRNPNFFHEIRMWWETCVSIGRTLYAIGGKDTPSSV